MEKISKNRYILAWQIRSIAAINRSAETATPQKMYAMRNKYNAPRRARSNILNLETSVGGIVGNNTQSSQARCVLAKQVSSSCFDFVWFVKFPVLRLSLAN